MSDQKLIGENTLVGSLTVVHTKHYSITGTLALVDGDLMDVSFDSDPPYHLGSEVSITIYTSDGLLAFDTFVIGKLVNRLMLIFPDKAKQAVLNRRRETRVTPTDMPGFIKQWENRAAQQTVKFEEPVAVTVLDISMSGAKLKLVAELALEAQDVLTFSLDLDESIDIRMELRHKSVTPDGFLQVGGEFVELTDTIRTNVRAFILKYQIAARPAILNSDHP